MACLFFCVFVCVHWRGILCGLSPSISVHGKVLSTSYFHETLAFLGLLARQHVSAGRDKCRRGLRKCFTITARFIKRFTAAYLPVSVSAFFTGAQLLQAQSHVPARKSIEQKTLAEGRANVNRRWPHLQPTSRARRGGDERSSIKQPPRIAPPQDPIRWHSVYKKKNKEQPSVHSTAPFFRKKA